MVLTHCPDTCLHVLQGGNDEAAYLDALPHDDGPAMSNMSDSDCMHGMHRFAFNSFPYVAKFQPDMRLTCHT